MVDTVLGYCGRCGAPFTSRTGLSCQRCGNPIVAAPPVSMGYSYPVMPTATVPGARHKLGRSRLLLVAGGALAVIVILVTLVAVVSRPQRSPCGLYCGPRIGARLVNAALYKNQKWGYSVEYDSSVLTIGNQDANGAEFDATNGDGSVVFTATQGTDRGTANQNAFNALPSATFQSLQPVGPVRGAEIGLVAGEGTAYSGQFAPADGSGATPIGVVIFSSSQNNVTLTVTAFSAASDKNPDLPYGLTMAGAFDYPVTNTLWGQQP